MQKLSKLLFFKLFIICLISIYACEDVIDFDVPSGLADAIAIQGKLVYNEPNSSLEVLITDLFDFDGNPRRLDILSVNIENEEGQTVELESRDFQTFFKSIPNKDLKIRVNQAFRLNVILKNGTHIQSEFDKIHAISSGKLLTQVTEFGLEDDNGEIQQKIEVSVKSSLAKLQDPETKIKWDVRRSFRFTNFNSTKLSSDNYFCNNTTLNADELCEYLRKNPGISAIHLDCDGGGVSNAAECDRGTNPFDKEDDNINDAKILKSCYVSSFVNSDGLKLLNPQDANEIAFDNDKIGIELFSDFVDFRFAEGYMVFAIAESLSPKSYEYHRGISQNQALRGGMFDPIAGNIKSNLKTIDGEELKTFGYFYATEQDTQQIFIGPNSVGNPDTLCPVIIPFVTLKASNGNPGGELCYCFDCTLWDELNEEISIFRPDFWEEEN